MKKLISYITQNRKSILIIIGIIIFILIIIQLLNTYLGNRTDEESRNGRSNSGTPQTPTNYVLSGGNGTISDQSVISDTELPEETIKSASNAIENFMDSCNNGNVEEAYNMISQDCKDALFPTIDDFNEYYYQPVFGDNKKKYSVENWKDNVYRVTFNDDINYIETGKLPTDNQKLDYFTIVDDNGENKLNINSFVKKEELNKEASVDDINIKALTLYQYIDYCRVTYEVTNNSDDIIQLDNLDDPYSMYLTDTDGNKYSADTGEIADNNLRVIAGGKVNVDIKYYETYSTDRKINGTAFSKIIKYYDMYNSYSDKSMYDKYGSINIEF